MKHYLNSKNEIFGYESDKEMLEYAKEVLTPITDEELAILQAPTPEQLAQQAKQEADRLRDEAMLAGKEYNGQLVSLTKDDGDGLLQVKAGFELGLTETVINFKNGTKLPIKASEFLSFAQWFVTERNRFFV